MGLNKKNDIFSFCAYVQKQHSREEDSLGVKKSC